jgi:hypothetical protein
MLTHVTQSGTADSSATGAGPASTPVPLSHRILEITAVLGVGILLAWMGVRVVRGIDTAGQLIAVVTSVLVGYLVADLISGIVHWMGDSLGDENTPWFGPTFSEPFRVHHSDPRLITVHGFVETNGNTCIVAMPPLIAAHAWMPAEPGTWFYLAVLVSSLALFGVATNQCHKWAHSARVPRLVALMQRWRLIIGPDHHERHHVFPHASHYCVLSGWMNILADGLRLFRGAEQAIRRLRPSWLNEDTVRRMG